MKPYKEETRQFILDTLLPYKLDPSTCGYDNVEKYCVYLTQDGRRCAVGKHLKEGEWLYSKKEVEMLNSEYGLRNILNEEANSHDLSLGIWSTMQSYHDSIASQRTHTINDTVKKLQAYTGFRFPELMFEQ
jgi:hypothetical protein